MLAFYVLIWPAIALAVLIVIVWTFLAELRQARRDGKKVV